MINYETILSLFDDKLTLLQYLTKIEEALKNEKLTDITVTQTDASHVYFTFVFEDGSTIDTPTFTLPQGAKGDTGATGADGVSVVDADIDASGHLIITLSNGNTIDAGATGLQTVTAGDIDSEEATQYEVLKADGNGSASWGRVTAGDIADNNQVGQYLGSTGYGFAGWKKFEVSGGQINSYAATAGQVLTANGSGSAGWEAIPAQTPEGTAIKSTGETSGKVLTADGSGGASWQTAGGGGTTLNKYYKETTNSGAQRALLCKILNNAKIVKYIYSVTEGITLTYSKASNDSLQYYFEGTSVDGSTLCIASFRIVVNSSDYTGSTTDQNRIVKITDQGVITNTTYTPKTFVIEYYNETEIT